jgi:hypothetical protein
MARRCASCAGPASLAESEPHEHRAYCGTECQLAYHTQLLAIGPEMMDMPNEVIERILLNLLFRDILSMIQTNDRIRAYVMRPQFTERYFRERTQDVLDVLFSVRNWEKMRDLARTWMAPYDPQLLGEETIGLLMHTAILLGDVEWTRQLCTAFRSSMQPEDFMFVFDQPRLRNRLEIITILATTLDEEYDDTFQRNIIFTAMERTDTFALQGALARRISPLWLGRIAVHALRLGEEVCFFLLTKSIRQQKQSLPYHPMMLATAVRKGLINVVKHFLKWSPAVAAIDVNVFDEARGHKEILRLLAEAVSADVVVNTLDAFTSNANATSDDLRAILMARPDVDHTLELHNRVLRAAVLRGSIGLVSVLLSDARVRAVAPEHNTGILLDSLLETNFDTFAQVVLHIRFLDSDIAQLLNRWVSGDRILQSEWMRALSGAQNFPIVMEQVMLGYARSDDRERMRQMWGLTPQERRRTLPLLLAAVENGSANAVRWLAMRATQQEIGEALYQAVQVLDLQISTNIDVVHYLSSGINVALTLALTNDKVDAGWFIVHHLEDFAIVSQEVIQLALARGNSRTLLGMMETRIIRVVDVARAGHWNAIRLFQGALSAEVLRLALEAGALDIVAKQPGGLEIITTSKRARLEGRVWE